MADRLGLTDLDPIERSHVTLNSIAIMVGVEMTGEIADYEKVTLAVAKLTEIAGLAMRIEGEGRQDHQIRPSLITALTAARQDAEERDLMLPRG